MYLLRALPPNESYLAAWKRVSTASSRDLCHTGCNATARQPGSAFNPTAGPNKTADSVLRGEQCAFATRGANVAIGCARYLLSSQSNSTSHSQWRALMSEPLSSRPQQHGNDPSRPRRESEYEGSPRRHEADEPEDRHRHHEHRPPDDDECGEEGHQHEDKPHKHE